MKKKTSTRSAFFNLRALLAFTLCFVGVALGLFAHFSPLTNHSSLSSATGALQPARYMPAPGQRPETEAEDLGRLEQYWNDRLTYPTGRFNPKWLRAAAAQHARLRSEEHTSELQSQSNLVCRLLLEKKKTTKKSR